MLHSERIRKMRKYIIQYNYYEPPNFALASSMHITNVDTASNLAEAKQKAYEISLAIQSDVPGVFLDFDYYVNKRKKKINSTTYCVVRFDDVLVGTVNIVLPKGEKLCKHCGSNPQDEPYCISSGPCPYCGNNI